MKEGNPVTGYVLLVLLVLVIGLVITTVARDMTAGDDPVQTLEPQEEDTQSQGTAARQPGSKPQQGRVWEGTM